MSGGKKGLRSCPMSLADIMLEQLAIARRIIDDGHEVETDGSRPFCTLIA